MLHKSFTRRLFILALAKVSLGIILISRLFYLQIKENHRFNYLSNRNRTSYVPLLPQRGIIFDYFHKPIANNVVLWQLLFIKSHLTKPLEELLSTLNQFIDIPQKLSKNIFKNYKIAYSYEPVLIKNQLTQDEIATIETYHYLFPEVFMTIAYNRQYIYPEATAHVVGYIGKVKDKVENKNIPNWLLGKQGIESSLDSILKGEIGYDEYEINSKGTVLNKLNTKPAKPGYNIALTIDIELQTFIYNLLEPFTASAIVLDIESGEILACVSTPSYDPNKISYGISDNEWKAIVNNPENPLTHRAISGLYPPASTIKPFIAMLGLDKQLIDVNTTFECKGHYYIGNRKFHCWLPGGHGKVNVSKALVNSCDIFFYNLGILLNKSDFNNLAEALQIPQVLLPLLPTCSKGSLPIKLDNPPLGELAIAAIGQGGWLVSPLHLANMASILANRGVIKELKILKEIDYKNKVIYSKPNKVVGKLPFSNAALNLTLNALQKAVNGNTPWSITGKTGTAQVVQITEEQRLQGLTQSNVRKYKDHAVFMGYMPSNNPKYALSIVMEHIGFASVHAVPLAHKITEFMYNKNLEYENYKQKLKSILSVK